ncbi:hypothetical protein EUGRSUZ_B02808 [Eucalyptus grandis]|uniref:Uncharacterized protein n=2 Tax=Eucalyptus grandis TaxID=71139 RepID=A0ACC3M1V4_EUCGR|nr:hypothetical protein EUGRSUZ_B02808 [Eucalyptus grandis]
MLASRSSTSKRSKKVTTALKGANEDELQCPSFTVVIRSHNLLKQNVTVPGGILREHINGSMQTATLKYRDGSWPVKLLYYPQHGSGKLLAGWASFHRGTYLKEGDVCLFELVRIDNVELKVSNFRRNAKI